MPCYDRVTSFQGADGGLCPRDEPVIKVVHGSADATVVVLITDPELEEQFPYTEGSSVSDDVVPVLAFRESWSTTTTWVVKGTRTGHGTFEFQIGVDATQQPGLFPATLALYATDAQDVENDPPLWSLPAWVEVEASLLSPGLTSRPLSVAELRLWLRDQCASANTLIGDVQYTDNEIAFAIQRCVDIWNEQPPDIYRYTPSTFPYRAHWARGAIGQLLQLGATSLEANHLSYSAGGVSVDDTSRYRSMRDEGRRLFDEYRGFVAAKKRELNRHDAWGML